MSYILDQFVAAAANGTRLLPLQRRQLRHGLGGRLTILHQQRLLIEPTFYLGDQHRPPAGSRDFALTEIHLNHIQPEEYGFAVTRVHRAM